MKVLAIFNSKLSRNDGHQTDGGLKTSEMKVLENITLHPILLSRLNDNLGLLWVAELSLRKINIGNFHYKLKLLHKKAE